MGFMEKFGSGGGRRRRSRAEALRKRESLGKKEEKWKK
jgi:hypothetical protein